MADSLKWTSALSFVLALVFVVITVGITSWKLAARQIEWPRLTPNVHDQASFWHLFTVVPILVTAYFCHHNGLFSSTHYIYIYIYIYMYVCMYICMYVCMYVSLLSNCNLNIIIIFFHLQFCPSIAATERMNSNPMGAVGC